MPIPKTETASVTRHTSCRSTNALPAAERALVRLACAGMRAADASKPSDGTRVAFAATLIELRHAADSYRANLWKLG